MVGRAILSSAPSAGDGAKMTGAVESQFRPIISMITKDVSRLELFSTTLSWFNCKTGIGFSIRKVCCLKSSSLTITVPLTEISPEVTLVSLPLPLVTRNSARSDGSHRSKVSV